MKKMKKISLFLSALFLLTMFACAPKQKEAYQAETQLQDQEQQFKELADDTSSVTPVVSSEMAEPEQTSTAVVLNPPHGQPGHICEIPVGSPLPASPAKATPATKKIETAKPVEKAQRLNPPHGEPGHRCEIAVGAPLDTPAPASAPPASNGSFTPTVENAARLKPGQR
jgi:cytoskeletal protein RodZ